MSDEYIEPYYKTGKLRNNLDPDDVSLNQNGESGFNIQAASVHENDIIQDNRVYNDNRTINIHINLPEKIDTENLINVVEQIKKAINEKPTSSRKN